MNLGSILDAVQDTQVQIILNTGNALIESSINLDVYRDYLVQAMWLERGTLVCALKG